MRNLKVGDLVKSKDGQLAIILSEPRKDPWMPGRFISEIVWAKQPGRTWTVYVDEFLLVGEENG